MIKQLLILLLLPFPLLGEIIKVNIEQPEILEIKQKISLNAVVDNTYISSPKEMSGSAMSQIALNAKINTYMIVPLTISLDNSKIVLHPDGRYLADGNYYHIKTWENIADKPTFVVFNREISLMPILSYDLGEDFKFFQLNISKGKLHESK